jgi:hypothetical protein
MTLPLDSATYLRTQRVPGNLPFGIYKYVIFAGDYPGLVWATDTAMVIKLNTGDGPVVEGGWSLEEGEKGTVNPAGTGRKQEMGDRLVVGPNPFNPTTTISYKLQASSHVSLKVYDTSGRLVATLADGWCEAGRHEVKFDGSDLPSGIYIYRMTAQDFNVSGKMVMVK